MNILVLNTGSSSVKYQLIEIKKEKVLAKGIVERIAIDGSRLKHKVNEKKHIVEENVPDHNKAIDMILKILVDSDYGVIKNVNEIKAVGHRVVHGGEFFSGSVLITDEVRKTLKDCIPLAPLHNPANIMGINAVTNLLPDVPQVGVFDTSFHQTIPEQAYLYGLPYKFYTEYKIRRYGFHGTSHRYVSKRAAEFLNMEYKKLKIITAHLGNGASISAVKNGKSIDTSMGYTPLEGLVMGTRCGDIDPAIPVILARDHNMEPSEVDNLLNKKSGVLGISTISSDMRDLEEKTLTGNKDATRALDIYCYKIKKYIGSYAAAMDGLDIIVFTAGVGENSPIIREKITDGLSFLGITIDAEKNKVRGKEKDISSHKALVRTLVIPTNEEIVIARDTKEIIEKDNK